MNNELPASFTTINPVGRELVHVLRPALCEVAGSNDGCQFDKCNEMNPYAAHYKAPELEPDAGTGKLPRLRVLDGALGKAAVDVLCDMG
ncbi:MAG TPA: hypothetical protein VK674_02130 [Candidatus Limnocylindria bacterium]|nr:hypothetical protein [Candidatus Limnocylindria bacterium]